MKKILFFLLCSAGFTSCFRTRLYVGAARPADPVVQVSQEQFNHHFVAGLIPGGNTTMATSEYVDGAESCVVQTNMSFLNAIVGSFTCGIYTPTQTKYYLPVGEINRTGNPE